MSVAERPKARRLSTSSVGFRLAVVLAVSLVPLGILAFWQNSALSDEARARSEAALLGQTMVAAETEMLLIRDMQVLSRSLAQAILPYLTDDAECVRTMRRAAAADTRYSFVAFTPVSGISTCNSSGTSFDFSDTAAFEDFSARQEPFIGVNPNSAVSGGSVLASVHPVMDDTGRFLGLTSVSVPHTMIHNGGLAAETLTAPPREKLELLSINAYGSVLTYSGDFDDAAMLMPLNMAERVSAATSPTVITAIARDGRPRTYAIVPLIASQLYLVGSWRGDVLSSISSLSRAGFIVPFLMLIVSIIGAMAAGRFFVSRYVRALALEMQQFAAGSRRLSADRNDGAPAEIRALTVAFDDMTARLMQDEAELENTIHQRDVLLREVHHRVKNNLQLIASMMNLQIRHAASDESKVMLRELQDRVMSLASIHRELYLTSGQADVRADELLTDICKRIVGIGSGVGRQIRSVFGFEDVHLSPDQAVPLSLIVTEALTNAVKYAGAPPGEPIDISVSLRREGGSLIVAEVANSLAPTAANDVGNDTAGNQGFRRNGSVGLGLRLIQAFTHQVNGVLTTEVEGDRHTLRVTFPVGDTSAMPDGTGSEPATDSTPCSV